MPYQRLALNENVGRQIPNLIFLPKSYPRVGMVNTLINIEQSKPKI